MNDKAPFTVDGVRGTKQYDITTDADTADENLAKELLAAHAKSENMVEWCFLPKKEVTILENNRRVIRFSLLANPFVSQTA